MPKKPRDPRAARFVWNEDEDIIPLTPDVKRAASGSANALNRAIGYLEAALAELAEAQAHVRSAPEGMLDAFEEDRIAEALGATLRQSGYGGLDSVRALRDRRAARAGFHFDDE